MPLIAHHHAGFTLRAKAFQENRSLTLRYGPAHLASALTVGKNSPPAAAVFSGHGSPVRGERVRAVSPRYRRAPCDTILPLKTSPESHENRSSFSASARVGTGEGSAPGVEQTSCCRAKGIPGCVRLSAAEDCVPLPAQTAAEHMVRNSSDDVSGRMKGDAAQDSVASGVKTRKGEGAAETVIKRSTGYSTIRNHFALLCLPYLMAAALIGTMHRRKRSRKQRDRRYRKLQNMMTERRHLKGTSCTAPKNYRVPDELADTILVKLETLEKNLFFLEKGMTLHKLAARLSTNTTYLSAIIRENKGCPFNSYLKELRISYVSRMLCENRQWRRYSVETLAAECGFKDRTNFARSFADYHGMTLGEFIGRREREVVLPRDHTGQTTPSSAGAADTPPGEGNMRFFFF